MFHKRAQNQRNYKDNEKNIEWIWEIGGVVYIVEMGVGSHGIRKPWDFVFRGELEFGIVSCEDIKTEENCIVFVGSSFESEIVK